MVQDDLWALATAEYGTTDVMLCIGCLEHRIGRELKADDFTEAPINSGTTGHWSDTKSDRLWDRLNRW